MFMSAALIVKQGFNVELSDFFVIGVNSCCLICEIFSILWEFLVISCIIFP